MTDKVFEIASRDTAHIKDGIACIHELIDGKEGLLDSVAAVVVYRTGEIGYHWSNSPRISQLAQVGALGTVQKAIVDRYVADE